MESTFLVLPKASDIRAARASMGWSQKELANKCNVSQVTIATIETEKSHPSKELLERIAGIFMGEDIYFLVNGGFKVEKNLVKIFNGRDGYLEAQDDMLKTCINNKEEILFLGIDDKKSSQEVIERKKQIYEAGIPCRYITSLSNDYCLGPVEDYRQIDPSYFFSSNVVAIYGNRFIFTSNNKTGLKSVLISDEGIVEQMKNYFENLWSKGSEIKKSSAKQIFFKK